MSSQHLEAIKTAYIDKIIGFFDGECELRITNDRFISEAQRVFNLLRETNTQFETYRFYFKTLTNYLQARVLPVLTQQSGQKMLLELIKRWEHYKILVFWSTKLFAKVDRSLANQKLSANLRNCSDPFVKDGKVISMGSSAIKIFTEEVYDHLKDQLLDALYQELRREREGEEINEAAIHQSMAIIVRHLSIREPQFVKHSSGGADYIEVEGKTSSERMEQDFEPKYLEAAQAYYRGKGLEWLSSMNCPEFLHAVQRALDFEETRVSRFLVETMIPKIVAIVVQEVILQYAQQVAEMEHTGCAALFKQGDAETLRLMYALFHRHDHPTETPVLHIVKSFKTHVKQTAHERLANPEVLNDPIMFAETALEYLREVNNLIAGAFNSDLRFQKERSAAFSEALVTFSASAQNLAIYCNHLMTTGLRGLSEALVEERIDDIVEIYRCLIDKDVFLKYYQIFLAGRLLEKTTQNQEAEGITIKKLAFESGENISRTLARMNEDINNSHDLQNEFRSLSHGGAPNGVPMELIVITSASWPDQADEACRLPPVLLSAFDAFRAFYSSKFNNRVVTCLTNLGNVELTVRGRENKQHTLLTNVYQASMLLLFNEAESLNIQEICDTTNLSEKLVKTSLLPFFNPKQKLLQKKSRGKVIETDEVVRPEPLFKANAVRINFRVKKATKNSGPKAEKERKEIEEERKLVIDSAIVRIMKSRNVCKHQDLIAEAVRQVRNFKPEISMIKNQIESLIQREFIKRSEENRAEYHYLP